MPRLSVNTGVRWGYILAPSLFNMSMDWVLSEVVYQGQLRASIRVTDVFADNVNILVEELKVQLSRLRPRHNS